MATSEDSESAPLSAVDTVALVKAGIIKANDVVKERLEALKAVDKLNATTTVLDIETGTPSGEAPTIETPPLGPLQGVSVVVKDNIHVKGFSCSAGCPVLEGFEPEEDAELVKRLRDAGAVVVGKATMTELAMDAMGVHSRYAAVNAVDSSLLPGGSSSGSATAVASGAVPVAIGSDTDGSIRIPAALQALVGFRPSIGRYPNNGIVPLQASRDTAGPIARSVADVALFDAVLASSTPSTPSPLTPHDIHVVAPRFHCSELDSTVSSAFTAVLTTLESAGVRVTRDVFLPDTDAFAGGLLAVMESLGPTELPDMASTLRLYLSTHKPAGVDSIAALAAGAADPKTRWLLKLLDGVEAVDRKEVDAAVSVAVEKMRSCLNSLRTVDGSLASALIYPTVKVACVKLSDVIVGTDDSPRPQIRLGSSRLVDGSRLMCGNTVWSAVAGSPSITLPVPGAVSPVGVCLEGPHGDDERLLSIAAVLEGLLNA